MGVSMTLPANWTVTADDPTWSCNPSTPNLVIVGNDSTTGDCPSVVPAPPQVRMHSAPRTAVPGQEVQVGTLKGVIVRSADTHDVDVVLAAQDVSVTFTGVPSDVLNTMVASLRQS